MTRSKKNGSLLTQSAIYEEALITSVVRFGESDCIVRLFSLNKGRLSAFYRRGFVSKKGQVQALAFGRVGLIESNKKLLRMISCDLDPSSALALFELKSFAYKAYLAEILEKFLPEEEPAVELFLAIKEAFLALETTLRSCTLRAFEVKLLDYCGYWPEMPSEEVMAFDHKNMRFTHEPSHDTWEFSPKALEMAKSMLIAKIDHINYEDCSELLMIGRIFQSRVRLLGCELKSASFLRQLNTNSGGF